MAGLSGSGRAARDPSGIFECGIKPHRPHVDVADEAQALSGDGPDHFLFPATVADSLARSIDAAGEGRIGDDPAAPDGSDEIIFADHAVAVLHQIDEEIEHLRLDGNVLRAAKQLATVVIKRMFAKDKLHVGAPTCSAELVSRNNQAPLKNKSRSRQSLPGVTGVLTTQSCWKLDRRFSCLPPP